MKIKIHPLFFVALVFYALIGGGFGYLIAFFAVTLHELAHYAVARIAGANDLTMVLMPYGAALSSKGEIPHFGAVLIAGPFANLALSSFSLSLCWIFPELYGYLNGFITLNVALAVFNLLPAYPLDGGRLFRLLFPKKWARVFTALLTPAVGVAAVVLFFTAKRFSLLTVAAFAALWFVSPIVGRRNRVREEEPLYCLAKTDEEGRLRPAAVVRGKRTVRRLSAAEVASLLLAFPSNTPIGEAIGKI